MERFAKNTLRMTAAFAMAIVLCLAAVAAYFIYPGTPGNSKYMKFEGYIELPRDRSLNILDYLTIDNGALFVTSESSGSLFKVDLDPNHPCLIAVSELPGAGSLHGVGLLMT